MIRVRFAALPVGSLFIAAARVAMANYLFARRGRGEMLLRHDDLDKDRARPGIPADSLVDQIEQDLRWFGIDWHMAFRQSQRLAVYQDAIERLRRDQFIYPCFETEEELKAKLAFRRKRNQPVIYDRAMLSLTETQRHNAEAGGKRPHWRFKLSGRILEWHDLVLGHRHASLSAVSDPILVRADGTPTALLASIVDDIDYRTTHIIRGDDSAGNTAVQIELFEVLRGTHSDIRFGHLPALHENGKATPHGRKTGNLTLRGLRTDGVEPYAVAAGLIGDSAAASQSLPLDALAPRFDLARLARSGFDVDAMLAVNRRILQDTDFAAIAGRLPVGATEAFWLAVRDSLDLLKDAHLWWDVVTGTLIPPAIQGARDLLMTARALLPPEPWDQTLWSLWVAAVEQETKQAGDAVIIPLRLALTGEDTGPGLGGLLPLIGRAQVANRLTLAAI